MVTPVDYNSLEQQSASYWCRRAVEGDTWRGESSAAGQRAPFTQIGALDEVAARQLGAGQVCYALRDALMCRVGQEGGRMPAAHRH